MNIIFVDVNAHDRTGIKVIYPVFINNEVIERIKARGRDMEINTDPEYWQKLFKRYEDCIEQLRICFKIIFIHSTLFFVHFRENINIFINRATKTYV
jgi:deoxyadenosine/deoxycytidine kinase